MEYTKREFLFLSWINTKEPFLHSTFLYRLIKQSILENKNLFRISEEELFQFICEEQLYTRKEYEKVLILIEDFFREEIQEEISNIETICKKEEIEMIPYGEENYPFPLKNIRNSPYVLYLKGKLPQTEILKKSVALVGSRDCSEEGKNFAKKVAQYLKKNKIYNISGLAKGIDSIGHLETLGQTGAILGQGLAREIYPRENQILASRILNMGGFLLSELPPLTPVSMEHLIARNRLQSGLTSGIIIAESALQGGTLHTFRFAREQGKKIYVASLNQKFIQKYHKDIIVLENISDFEKKKRENRQQKTLF